MIEKNEVVVVLICLFLSFLSFVFVGLIESVSSLIGGLTAILINTVFRVIFFSVPYTSRANDIFSAAVVAMIVKWLLVIFLVSGTLLLLDVQYKFYLLGFVIMTLINNFLTIFYKNKIWLIKK